MCALGISAPVAELEFESIMCAQGFSVIKDMPEQPSLLCRAPGHTRAPAGHLHLSGMVKSLKSSVKNLEAMCLIYIWPSLFRQLNQLYWLLFVPGPVLTNSLMTIGSLDT